MLEGLQHLSIIRSMEAIAGPICLFEVTNSSATTLSWQYILIPQPLPKKVTLVLYPSGSLIR